MGDESSLKTDQGPPRNLDWFLDEQRDLISPFRQWSGLDKLGRPDGYQALTKLATFMDCPEYSTELHSSPFDEENELLHVGVMAAFFFREHLSYGRDSLTTIRHLIENGHPVNYSWSRFLSPELSNDVLNLRPFLETSRLITPLVLVILIEKVDNNTRTKIARILLENGADPNIPFERLDIDQRTFEELSPIMFCILTRDVTMVKLLLDFGARIDTSFHGWSPLQLALLGGDKNIIQALVDRGVANSSTVAQDEESSFASCIRWSAILGTLPAFCQETESRRRPWKPPPRKLSPISKPTRE
ncbi:Ankyrin repeat and SOCS box protein 3 [Lecanora helva]